ncbi:hypothetical protein GGH94_002497 [Coemansia aciculifera]|uniref:Uncharacterized protein n=1 Tax=Coemansia aciculifera TaxID=417176 RepID=A0A9W8IJL9_9FUNG|nr:hypothetical protein GGH94_002497 [Coemansia aciculifera]KAJ2874767.1 hypothetical protein GGH93_002126 [Coemansia aciculifera]KAJ2885345.1 hypothetical protein H4R27_001473 [Coemansia aciculifera]
MTNSQANDKKEALKRKLRGTAPKAGSVAKPGRTTAQRPRQQKQVKEGLLKLAASTKHTAGRRSVRQALDQTTMHRDVSESLRGINQAPILTLSQLAQKAKQEREKMAVIYEQHQTAVSETVDELAQLMSSG